MFKSKVVMEDVEIRGFEERTSKKTNKEYLIVKVDDQCGDRSEIIDYNLERKPIYKRGMTGNLTVKIDIGKFANVEVINFEVAVDKDK